MPMQCDPKDYNKEVMHQMLDQEEIEDNVEGIEGGLDELRTALCDYTAQHDEWGCDILEHMLSIVDAMSLLSGLLTAALKEKQALNWKVRNEST